MWVWSSNALSLFLSKLANNWREPHCSLQLLTVFDTNNKSTSKDQTNMTKRIIVYNYSVVMWVWPSDALSLFVSQWANNWRPPHRSLPLLALFDTNSESASKDQTHMTKRIIVYNYSVVMWVWSSDAPSLFVSKRANNWRERLNSLQLLAVLDTNNESACEDQTHMTKWIIVYNYSVVMWVWSSDALSLFVSKSANNWWERFNSRQLLLLLDTNNESATEDQTHMRKWIIVYNYSVVMWVWSSDALSLLVSKRANDRRERCGSLQLLALFDINNESACDDQTHMRKWITLYYYSVLMWVWSSHALSLFQSKRANNWREPPRSLQLLALFDTNNESASEDQTHMTTE
jgi:hypothetical protein